MPHPRISEIRRLRDRLSDLSMRNRSLRLTRLSRRRAFDLAWLDQVQAGSSAKTLARLLRGERAAVPLLSVGEQHPRASELHRGLTNLDREALLVEQERGTYDLSVGVGFLCGALRDGKFIQAPLFLLPRRLVFERLAQGGSRWTLVPLGDDAKQVHVNRTLLLALQRFAALTLDPDELEDAGEDLLFRGGATPGWLETIAQELTSALRARGLAGASASLSVFGAPATGGVDQVPPLPEYTAETLPQRPPMQFELRPHAVLSRFPLADTALLTDYEALIRLLEDRPNHPLGYTGRLLGSADHGAATPPGELQPWPHWQIEPSDESQEDVLRRARAGWSMAVHGPPGTGKSQFIANLVGTALAEKKRVLVVSQKRPALDVVKQRLGADLSRFVALIHDPALDREGLCRQIRASLGDVGGVGGNPGGTRANLVHEIEQQTSWFAGLHDALGQTAAGRVSPVDAYTLALGARGKPAHLGVRKLPACLPAELERALPDLVQLATDRQATRTPGTWLAERPDLGARTHDELEELLDEAVPEIVRTWKQAEDWKRSHQGALGDLDALVARSEALLALRSWCERAALLSDGAWCWLPILAKEAEASQLGVERDQLSRFIQARDAASGELLQQEAPSLEDLEALVERWGALSTRWWRILLPEWYRVRDALATLLSREQIQTSDIRAAVEIWRARYAFGQEHERTQGALLLFAQFPLDRMAARLDDVFDAHRDALASLSVRDAWMALPVEARAFVGDMPCAALGAEDLGTFVHAAIEGAGIGAAAQDSLARLEAWVGPIARTWICNGESSGPPLEDRVRDELSSRFLILVSADLRAAQIESAWPRLAPLVHSLAALDPSEVESELRRAYAQRWIRDAEQRWPVLSEARGTIDQRRDRLRGALDRLPQASRAELHRGLTAQVARIPPLSRTDLDYRAGQRRKRWSLRKMVTELWSRGLSDLFPVWLCSPETVAAIFPLQSKLFDYVVFDEASQCTLAQGLTATFRGSTCIIVGDEQQLPPSRLFSTTLEDEDEDEGVPDEESLLSRARSAGQQAALRWHYRSRFPDLIAFSNAAFYDGELRVAPAPLGQPTQPALEWVSVPGRWVRRVNEVEAHAAVELFARYLAEHPDRSIGVITLNRQQADLIQDLVEQRAMQDEAFRARLDLAMARSLDERPFVRNLENVQGDERDVIVLSVSYAADESGRVPLRFGALSLQGGERRLNVAISRAREKMLVLCSFDPESQLVLSETTGQGARSLKEYLLYARARGANPAPAGGGLQPQAAPAHGALDLAAGLRARLEARGWQSDLNVGTSTARIELAIRSRTRPDSFALAVVFDGPSASWASTPAGREVGRPTWLARFGWEVASVSLPALAHDPEGVVGRLSERAERADQRMQAQSAPPSVSLDALVREIAAPPPVPTQTPRTSTVSTTSEATATGAVRPPPRARTGEPSRVRAMPATSASASAEPSRRVRVGGVVRYRDVETGEEHRVAIGGPAGMVGVKVASPDSPLAEALLEAELGDVVVWEHRDRSRELEVLAVE